LALSFIGLSQSTLARRPGLQAGAAQ